MDEDDLSHHLKKDGTSFDDNAKELIARTL